MQCPERGERPAKLIARPPHRTPAVSRVCSHCTKSVAPGEGCGAERERTSHRPVARPLRADAAVSYTHLRAHETEADL
eukprot:2500930-Rhodomonas_salina.1